MQLIPLHTEIIKEGDDLAGILCAAVEIKDKDILVVSSKLVATAEGGAIDLAKIAPGDEAKAWAEKLHRTKFDPAFRQAILEETERMHGAVHASCPHAMLTELRPEGLSAGSILAANAGLDHSNIEEGYAIGWPRDPVASVKRLRTSIEKQSGRRIAVILSDSCCRPRRIGVTAFALVVSGMDPLETQIGKKDLFGKELLMTQEARADQLATAANFLMGNAAQAVPAVVIRDHGLELSDYEGWVPAIEPGDDLFKGVV